MEEQPAGESFDCALCGASASGPPITWMFENHRRRGCLWYCERCARDNAQAVEAKLDQEWW